MPYTSRQLGVYMCNVALQRNIMYHRHIESNIKNSQAHDAQLKVNSKERLAANAAYKKRNKGQVRAIIAADGTESQA